MNNRFKRIEQSGMVENETRRKMDFNNVKAIATTNELRKRLDKDHKS